jgi:hypothetical protein
MVVCQFIVAITGVAAKNATIKGGNPTAVRAEIAFICLNIASFATTWGPAAWVVVGEMFPLPIRSRGVGMSTASNWWVSVPLRKCFELNARTGSGTASLA